MIQIENFVFSLCLVAPFVISFSLFRTVFGYFNFAFGSIHAATLYVTYLLLGSDGSIIAAGVAVAAVLIAACALHAGLLEPLRRRKIGRDGLLIVSLGVYLIAEQLLSLTFGDAIAFPAATILSRYRIQVPGLGVSQLVIIVTSLSLILAYEFIIHRTELGERIQAVSEAPELCRIVGLNVGRLQWSSFFLSLGFAVLGAATSALETGAVPTAGFNLVLLSFAVCLIGGDPFSWQFPLVLTGVLGIGQVGAILLSSQWSPTLTYIIVLSALYLSRRRKSKR